MVSKNSQHTNYKPDQHLLPSYLQSHSNLNIWIQVSLQLLLATKVPPQPTKKNFKICKLTLLTTTNNYIILLSQIEILEILSPKCSRLTLLPNSYSTSTSHVLANLTYTKSFDIVVVSFT